MSRAVRTRTSAERCRRVRYVGGRSREWSRSAGRVRMEVRGLRASDLKEVDWRRSFARGFERRVATKSAVLLTVLVVSWSKRSDEDSTSGAGCREGGGGRVVSFGSLSAAARSARVFVSVLLSSRLCWVRLSEPSTRPSTSKSPGEIVVRKLGVNQRVNARLPQDPRSTRNAKTVEGYKAPSTIIPVLAQAPGEQVSQHPETEAYANSPARSRSETPESVLNSRR